MSAIAENFAFIVKTDKSLRDQIPVLSRETLEQYKADIEKHLVPTSKGKGLFRDI